MERNQPQWDQPRWDATVARIGNQSPLLSALANLVGSTRSADREKYHRAVWNALTDCNGLSPHQQKTLEDFWSPELAHAVETLTDPGFAETIHACLQIRVEGPSYVSLWPGRCRSAHFGYYANACIRLVESLIQIYYYVESIPQLLLCDLERVVGCQYLLAWELRQGNPEIHALVEEALYGDNSQLLPSTELVAAIIISSHDAQMAGLLKLLQAAQLQEGLRQHILWKANCGSLDTMRHILKFCMDENLFRFSSVIQAFLSWIGLGLRTEKPKNIKQCAMLAYECLVDGDKRQEYLQSANNLEAYLALWAQGCEEISLAKPMVQSLLDDPRPHRQVLGWFFISSSGDPSDQMTIAGNYLHIRDEEPLAWIIHNLNATWDLLRTALWDDHLCKTARSFPNENLPDSITERRRLFQALWEVAQFIGTRKRTFTGNPFDFIRVTLENAPVLDCMISLAGYDKDSQMISQLLQLPHLMSPQQRRILIRALLSPESEPTHRAFLHSMLRDRSVHVREQAAARLSACTLLPEDLNRLMESLGTKGGAVRKTVLSILQAQPSAVRSSLIAQLLDAQEEALNQGGIELLLLEKDKSLSPAIREALARLRKQTLSTQTEILLRQLPQEQEMGSFTPENGFGLYQPDAVQAYLDSLEQNHLKNGNFPDPSQTQPLLTEQEIKQLLPTWEAYDQLLNRLDQVFVRHADFEYDTVLYNGARKTVLWGDVSGPSYDHCIYLPASCGCHRLFNKNARLDMVPFYDEFLEALGVYAQDIYQMLGLYYVHGNDGYQPHMADDAVACDWIFPIEEKGLFESMYQRAKDHYKRWGQLSEILHALPSLFPPQEVCQGALHLYQSMVAIFGEENLGKPYWEYRDDASWQVFDLSSRMGINHHMLKDWRSIIRRYPADPNSFAIWFHFQYRLEHLVGNHVHAGLDTEAFLRALDEKLISQDVFTAFLLDTYTDMPEKMRKLTSPQYLSYRELMTQHPWAQSLVQQAVDRIVTMEEQRGELPTPLTGHCQAIGRLEGARHFCNLLAALGRGGFHRGYAYSNDTTKQTVLSHLLKCCYPAGDDTPEELAALLKQTDIRSNRLVEAVMYAPQWAGFAETILDWPGLKSGVWFFHAHINETFSAEKETEVAIYSPIPPEQFSDGALDRDWFFQAYEQLGAQRFQLLYQAAKYITSGSNRHRRSQLYSDALLGKLDARQMEVEIANKRNQEQLRCYPLIPMAQDDIHEALRRYAFIQKFQKESKQFGAQRQESEKKACAIALENLAITMGLTDVNRLIWQMEGAKLAEIQPLLEPVTLENVSIQLVIDEEGDARLITRKDGRVVKTPPKILNQNKDYLERKEAVKELKEQKRRSRISLEQAMITSATFSQAEFSSLLHNPILAPMVKKLVWISEDCIGFPALSGDAWTLVAADGAQQQPTGMLRIAHPHDLKEAKVWPNFMHLLYEKQWVQPFKQVFREYYPITQEELQERTVSRRYAGHQVQPRQTISLLRGRGWTVDYDQGLQKVFYRENLIVHIFALADWFSPADTEAPTLETVTFTHRHTGALVPLEEVPPILFSEVMRDLDLAVSVAHASGVDPEASHSTMEMRIAIATELVTLLRLPNVSWLKAHAKIQGTLANYSVHMGSGVIHAEGIGMIAILPIHSQARGRIFLPFADDDPKTAEIMSKIVLLAEDQKIKDPAIIRQICP